ncbi:hypothetical protein M404DRAFT_34859 [Pisolithus tinctorius Marx 270]|uniref:Uncharacterized protein n=1 Tax=Pisolithus tinctorius Marx 270 TaxID=870435 RepID=A0A0C3NFT5_PISTI|nr:hypothetical protein M404DRAFT_34859 [Pisolithus tinctorius Marx 270]
MSFQHKNTTPQPTPGHSCDYSQVMDDALVILTDNSTNTEHEKNTEKTHWREEKVEEVQLEVEQRQREEEEVQRKKVAEDEAKRQRQKVVAEEAKRQRQRASQEQAQARQDEAAQK